MKVYSPPQPTIPLSIAGQDALLVLRMLELAKEAGYSHIKIDGEQVELDPLIESVKLEVVKSQEPAHV